MKCFLWTACSTEIILTEESSFFQYDGKNNKEKTKDQVFIYKFILHFCLLSSRAIIFFFF